MLKKTQLVAELAVARTLTGLPGCLCDDLGQGRAWPRAQQGQAKDSRAGGHFYESAPLWLVGGPPEVFLWLRRCVLRLQRGQARQATAGVRWEVPVRTGDSGVLRARAWHGNHPLVTA